MPTTPTYAFRYPSASDAADGPTQMQNLATDVETILAGRFAARYVQKSADESVTSSTTLQNDDHLMLASIPVGTWEITGEIFHTGTSASAADIKLAFAFPTGTISWSGISLLEAWGSGVGAADVAALGVVNVASSPTAAFAFGAVSSQTIPIHIKGHLVNSATGTLQLQWAQNTSNATATTVKQGSWIALRPLV